MKVFFFFFLYVHAGVILTHIYVFYGDWGLYMGFTVLSIIFHFCRETTPDFLQAELGVFIFLATDRGSYPQLERPLRVSALNNLAKGGRRRGGGSCALKWLWAAAASFAKYFQKSFPNLCFQKISEGKSIYLNLLVESHFTRVQGIDTKIIT